ncbi:MAG: transporter [Flavobacteriales bacterium]|nr:transporter [Flavobacteriales bacterium]
MKKIILILNIIAFTANGVYAGGWLKGEKKGFFKLNESIIVGDQFYSGDGSLQKITTTGVYITSLYGEYGVSKNMDVIVYVPFFNRLTINDVRFSDGGFQAGDSFNAFGDIDLGLKFGLRQGKSLVISVTLLLGIPLGVTDGGDSELLQSGDGEFNQMLRLDVGYGFKKPFYTNVGLGFNNRTNGFSEEFRYDFELGYKYNEKLVLAFKLLGNESFNNGDQKGSGGNGLFSNNLEFLAFGPEVSYYLTKSLGISAAYRTASSGQFIIAAPSYELGVFLS